MNCQKLIYFLIGVFTLIGADAAVVDSQLLQQPGFFRASFESVSMPNGIQDMGLFGITYNTDVNSLFYTRFGGYGAITGSQGGLFILGFGGGLHHQLLANIWGDAGLLVGGGGGRSSLVGGGLMLQPYAGIAYDWRWVRTGIYYSYVDFPSSEIRSQQLGLNIDVPFDFYYLSPHDGANSLFKCCDFHLDKKGPLHFHRNDFALLLQDYSQRAGIHNTNDQIQDGNIALVGAELDHYITTAGFWWLKMSGAFHGIPNGYMDVLGGLGYHWAFGAPGFALVPQLGAGAGGGGLVDSGGGFIMQPQLGIEWPLTSHFSGRVSGGYLWAPGGEYKAYTLTGEILYHLDIATLDAGSVSDSANWCKRQAWRAQLFNQTYLHPQRSMNTMTSAANLIIIQVDQIITPAFFLTYQAGGAYGGDHMGGYATGMIGPGLQSPKLFHQQLQFFTELLLGAGGGGGLALGGGALIEPVAGIYYSYTPMIGLQASVGQVKALHNDLNTTVVNLGLTLRFDTLDRVA